jgi:hypothetical protein
MTAPALSAVDVFDAIVGTTSRATLPGRDEHDQAVSLAAGILGAQMLHDDTLTPSSSFATDPHDAARRVGRSDFGNWLHTVGASAQGCARPVRLSGSSTTVNPRTGEVLEAFDTNTLPDAVLYKPCGSRLASVCPSCAETYRYDTYQLIASGLRGGKGVPESVACHPAVFATFTAPSFGPVHTANVDRRSGKIRPCRPRRDRPVCPHGKPLSCPQRHHQGDSCVGTPLCLDCYQHEHQVAFNAYAPKLWARTIDALTRSLRRIAKAHGVTMKLRYAKVAEFQARGVIHLHAIFRLDGYHPDTPEAVLPPPACLTADDVCQLIRDAAANTAIATPAHPDRPEGWPLGWGEQLDTRIVRTGIADEQVTEQHVAGYLAKYATKSTETVGGVGARMAQDPHSLRRMRHRTDTHLGRLLDACWRLGRDEAEDYNRLRPKAHMLGFSGHFSTKSRRYSTTLGALRAARRPSARAGVRVISPDEFDTSEHLDDDTTLVIDRQWTYLGSGWLTLADAALANASAAHAREHRPHTTSR